ncbi:ATP-binding protein [Lutimaribacter saemankumensis]|uniref:Histidine kinase-, DNA gyrase B-, and HSP90-like ATPase n=1 Tax=Lutimaribacter saemankumensis TaxID=490829 RepID=A0A1G8NMH2_9RHOB|nr:ATP-binding protein [Lutimaribacter saemankumensis]SDI81332.1 Histidine kinase-, DNA gyrase B-, and HSP90-like ATPase [Lutimaribacter saemankumensis]
MADVLRLDGSPTKRFFVEMLPRDIELDDAILDLVDNSVDGAMRRARRERTPDEERYKGMWCRLEIDATRFCISDNCGGIPEKYFEGAFHLGRPSVDLDDDIPTIGVYGIGMKRAIFKIGRNGNVETRHPGFRRRVSYPRGWFDKKDWELEVSEINPDSEPDGVKIIVDDLLPDVADQFKKEAALNNLRSKLGLHFAYIMELGFCITVNGVDVVPQSVLLKNATTGGIVPFAFSANVNRVEVTVSVGVFRRLAKESEIQDETEIDGPRSLLEEKQTQKSGITVICNDRVVLVNDTTDLTGWGVGGVPKYHPQFRAIGGQISFKSDDASLLPISTTKRDLDTHTALYNMARNETMTGLKAFISLTNKWKRQEEKLNEQIDNAPAVDARSVVAALITRKEATNVRNLPGAKRFVPELPKPQGKSDSVWVRFERPQSEARRLGAELLEDPGAKPSEIGEAVWRDALRRYDSE